MTALVAQGRRAAYCTLVILAMDVAMRPPGENVAAEELLGRWKLYKDFEADVLERIKNGTLAQPPTEEDQL